MVLRKLVMFILSKGREPTSTKANPSEQCSKCCGNGLLQSLYNWVLSIVLNIKQPTQGFEHYSSWKWGSFFPFFSTPKSSWDTNHRNRQPFQAKTTKYMRKITLLGQKLPDHRWKIKQGTHDVGINLGGFDFFKKGRVLVFCSKTMTHRKTPSKGLCGNSLQYTWHR